MKKNRKENFHQDMSHFLRFWGIWVFCVTWDFTQTESKLVETTKLKKENTTWNKEKNRNWNRKEPRQESISWDTWKPLHLSRFWDTRPFVNAIITESGESRKIALATLRKFKATYFKNKFVITRIQRRNRKR